MTTSKHQTRVINSITGRIERPTLQWLAARAPSWMSPDMLTVIGVLGAAIAFVAYCLTNLHAGYLWLASLGLAINWLGDSLDGTLARFRHIERPRYGFFVDHTADAFSQLLIVLGLGLTPYVDFAIACLLLISYLLMSVAVYVRTIVDGVFQITFGKLGPTEARIAIVLFNTAVVLVGNPSVRLRCLTTTVADLTVAAIAAGLFATFCVSVVHQICKLAKLSD